MRASAPPLIGGLRLPAVRSLVWAALFLAPPVLGLLSLGVGRYPLPLAEVLTALGQGLGISESAPELASRVVLLIRLPRVLEALVAGAGLAIAGAALQGVFRNPLVGPQLIGVSSGAAFGGALALFLSAGLSTLLGATFLFGLLALVIVFLFSRVDGRAPVLMLVLSGVVVGAFFSALVSLVTYLADPNDTLPAIVYWLMGSFATASYPKLALLLAVTVPGVALLVALRFRINVLSLGDEEARALGIQVEPTRWLVLLAVTAITASGVAVAGIVGWVGLVVPHIARMLVGPDHKALLPASALAGAAYMVLVDDLARTATTQELPLGVLTALVGAPLFGLLLRRAQAKGWST
ncbi:MAG: iron ABC transporter permease [Rhodospirillum sp.]|nr:iron ABC transporter permease [Rhodospirillum sp.]MCF8490111.1 iron ABC transporter permease [Rhodospirillum sp.]